jgi:hypothetical protein
VSDIPEVWPQEGFTTICVTAVLAVQSLLDGKYVSTTRPSGRQPNFRLAAPESTASQWFGLWNSWKEGSFCPAVEVQSDPLPRAVSLTATKGDRFSED